MNVDILIPTYNRKSFEDQIAKNINKQDYPFIRRIIIADDGDDEPLCIKTNHVVEYHRVPRMSIGAKRNYLIEQSTAEYCAFMDTDDFYHPSYLSMSILNLILTQKSLSGSSDMLITQNMEDVFITRCIYMDMLNEATMVFKRSHYETHKFHDRSHSEGLGWSDIKCIAETPIHWIMICRCHESNTVDKTPWLKDTGKVNGLDLSPFLS